MKKLRLIPTIKSKTTDKNHKKRKRFMYSKEQLIEMKKKSEAYKTQGYLINKKYLKLKYNYQKLSQKQRYLSLNMNIKKLDNFENKNPLFNTKSRPYIEGFLDSNLRKMFLDIKVCEKTKNIWNKIKMIQRLGGFKNSRRRKFSNSVLLKSKNHNKLNSLKNPKKKTKKLNSFLKNFENIIKYQPVFKLPKKFDRPEKIENLYYNKNIIINKNFPLETSAFSKGGFFNNRFGVIGGYGLENNNKLTILNLEDGKITLIKNDIFERFHHSSLTIANFLIINGGQKNINKKLLNDTLLINLESNKIFKIRNFGLKFPFKKNHISFYHKNKYYIQGGFGNDGKIEASIFSVDLISFIVTKIILENNIEFLAHHNCVKVGFENISDLKIKYNDFYQSKKKKIIRKENKEIKIPSKLIGIFIFGGINKKNICNNIMKKLNPHPNSKKKWITTYPSVNGKKPNKRFDHQMVYINKINSIAICGGRTYYQKKNNDMVLNDLFLFSIKNYLYIKIEVKGDVCKRYGFTMFCDDGNLFIFGGLNEKNFIDGNILKLPINNRIKQGCNDFLL